ncbi:hypothetical protein HID58_085301 [Brassica napus]|uniref:RNase H type-1 domain-containing protein n=1 Tax=Brassica napus TaxID=3708 RepID=A0ABQ7XQ31_BRANA|nr:hypothetical protein HID58_085301 [Brassica napus]
MDEKGDFEIQTFPVSDALSPAIWDTTPASRITRETKLHSFRDPLTVLHKTLKPPPTINFRSSPLGFSLQPNILPITMSQSSLLIRSGVSSNRYRKAPQLEDDIIRIPECDLNDVKERFRLTLIGLSIDADKPLQFEQRIGFPSGDIGKVTLTYDGLHQERELKRKLRLENLENNEQSRFPIQGSQGFTSRNPLKRARSPTNGRHPSPSATSRYSELNREEKRRRSASSSYQPREARVTDTHARDRKSSSRQENHYTQHGREVWSRLENPSRRKELQGSQRGRTPNHSERNTSRKETSRPSHKPSAEWQPRRFSGEHRKRTSNHLAPRQTEDERMERSRATFDSQKTITDNRVSLESGEIFETHRSEVDVAMAEEERTRRLKGKAIATGPPSPKHKTPRPLPADAPQVKRYDQPLLEQDDAILDLEEGLDQVLDAPLTELESAEVDNLVLEMEHLEMAEKMMAENNIDENMIDLDNDDLLGDSPDLADAEKIEAISQLSPANVVTKKASSTSKQLELAKTAAYIQDVAQASGSDAYVPKVLLKKKDPRSPDIKGARMVLTNEDGMMTYGSFASNRVLTPLHAEFQTLFWAMKSSIQLDHCTMNFKTDCLQLVKLLEEDEEDN